MKKMKKMIILMTAFVMAVGILIPAAVFADDVKTYQDGFYTSKVMTEKTTFGWKQKKDGTIQNGYSYPSNDYELPVTIQIKDGKIVDVAYTQSVDEINVNSGSDFNYLTWAMEGHEVTDYTYEYYCGNYTDYHMDPFPPKNGKGMREQIIEKNGTEGVDTVTAASITSKAIIASVNQSLEKAAKGEKDDPEPVLPKEDDTPDTVPADGVYYYPEAPECDGATLTDGTFFLRVKDGKMFAQMGISQRKSSFPYLYPGTEKEALAAGETGWFYPQDNEYGYTSPGVIYREIPLKSVDKMIPFVIKTKSSGNWFNRRLKIDSTKLQPIKSGYYEPNEFKFEGGTGKVTITCPRVKIADDGQMMADLVFSSINYTEAVVDEVKYEPVVDKKAGTSTFTVPVFVTDSTYADLHKDMVISATTVAMSSPHTVDYTFSVKVDPANLKMILEENEMTVKPVNKKFTAKKLKKKAATFKAVTVKKNAGKVTYAGKAANKKSKKVLKFNAKTAKITVKKGTKKGTYKMKVTVKDPGSDSVKSAKQTVTVTVKVK